MNLKISVVIPNWNGQKYLKTCLESLRGQSSRDFEIILVDNGSQDQSIEFVMKNYPEVLVFSLPKNEGFSKAVNIGIKKASGDYIALLNNDTEVSCYWIESLREAFEQHSDYYFFACKMLSFDQREIIDSAGDSYLFLRDRYFIQRNGAGQKDGNKFNHFQEVFGACGGAAVYRRELFDKIGFFDEDFFAFCEDVDFSFRAQLAGFRCLYVPLAVVYHMRGGSTKDINYFTEYLRARNDIYLIIKNIPFRLIIKYFRQTIGFIFLWTLKDLVKIIIRHKNKKGAEARLNGRWHALKNLRKTYKKRRQIQKNRIISESLLENILLHSWFN